MKMARAPPTELSDHQKKGDDKIQSMIPWIGGKQSLYRLIISRFPADFRERTYVEVFGGVASVLLNKERSVKEIYNDFNSSLVNLFRMVRENPLELQKALRYVLNSREDFERARRALTGRRSTDIQRAAWFYPVIPQSYGSGLHSFSELCGRRHVIRRQPPIHVGCVPSY